RITREYEDAQDRLFRVQTRLTEIGGSAKALSEAEEALANADAELARSPWTAQQIGDLAARARRAEHDAQRRDMQIADISRKRERATLKAAMQAVKVGSPAELLVVLEQRNEAAMRREEALAHLERIRNDAAAGAAAAEIAKLREEKAQLEQRIATQGFARALADVEADLHKALQRSAAGRQ